MKQAKCLDFNVTKISYTIFKKKSLPHFIDLDKYPACKNVPLKVVTNEK